MHEKPQAHGVRLLLGNSALSPVCLETRKTCLFRRITFIKSLYIRTDVLVLMLFVLRLKFHVTLRDVYLAVF